MRTQMNFDAVREMPDDMKRGAIARAVQFEFRKAAIAAAMLGAAIVHLRPGVQVIGKAANDGNAGPDIKLIEQAIAKHYNDPVLKKFGANLPKIDAKYATPDQSPVLTTAAQSMQAWFHNNMPELDVGYLALFDLVDLRNAPTPQFEINTTSLGLTWTQRKPGDAVKIRRSPAESQLVVKYLEFAEGLGILDQWLQFNQFWNIDEAVAEFRSTEADKRASLHYGLLTALGAGIDVAFATDDATTFNAAAAAIIRNLANSGYGLGANPQFDIVCAPEKVGRILAFLDAKRGSPMIAFGTQDQPIAFSVRNVIATRHVTSADTGYYLVLPGRKLKRGEWLDLTLESQRDIAHSATDWVGRVQYNAAVGDSNQVRRVKYA